MKAKYAKPYYRNMDPRKAMEICDLYFARVFKQVELAEIYGLRQNSVSRIVAGKVWKQGGVTRES